MTIDETAVALRLSGGSAALSGELVARRLKALADALGVSARLEL
jgi:hypothetical protein